MNQQTAVEAAPDAHVFFINLDRAVQRREHMERQLNTLGMPYTRIEAVLGKDLEEPIEGFDEKRFHVLTGKRKSPGEIGCYFSHIKALKAFLETDKPYALMLEDDVTIPANLPALLVASVKHSQTWDLLRLTSSREGKFLPIISLSNGYTLAYNLKVLKNTGGYFINRLAAEACVSKMLPMCLPFDVALDREWDFGFKTACMNPLPLELADFDGQISKAPRVRIYRATTFHLFHILTHFQRKKHRRAYWRKLSKIKSPD